MTETDKFWSTEDGLVLEFGTAEFARRLGLPPGTEVTDVLMAWETLAAESSIVRVRVQPGALVPVLSAPPLATRLRELAGKWHAQSRHPQHRFRPEVSALLAKHADELQAELREGSS